MLSPFPRTLRIVIGRKLKGLSEAVVVEAIKNAFPDREIVGIQNNFSEAWVTFANQIDRDIAYQTTVLTSTVIGEESQRMNI